MGGPREEGSQFALGVGLVQSFKMKEVLKTSPERNLNAIETSVLVMESVCVCVWMEVGSAFNPKGRVNGQRVMPQDSCMVSSLGSGPRRALQLVRLGGWLATDRPLRELLRFVLEEEPNWSVSCRGGT